MIATGEQQPSEALSIQPTVDPADLEALLEALLLVSPEPARLRDLANAAGVAVADVEATLAAMPSGDNRGWVVVRHRDTLHLASAPRFAETVRRFLRLERESRLSGAALETLALIAYREPVTRAEIEAMRGVDCTGVLATLHARGLIEIAGKLPTVGNPNQYVTTVEFLRQFGLNSMADLPPLDTLAPGEAERLFDEYTLPPRDASPDGGETALTAVAHPPDPRGG